MKMFNCIEPFKTTLFKNGEVIRTEIEKESLWFLVKKESQDKIILSNNKIELTISEKILNDKFKRWG